MKGKRIYKVLFILTVLLFNGLSAGNDGDVTVRRQRIYWEKLVYTQIYEDTSAFKIKDKTNFLVNAKHAFSNHNGRPQYDISKSGKRIVYVKKLSGSRQIYLLDLRQEKKQLYNLTKRLTNEFLTDNLNPVISGDGNYVAFISNRDGRSPSSIKNVYIVDIAKINEGTENGRVCNITLHNKTTNAVFDTYVQVSDNGMRVAYAALFGLVIYDLTPPAEATQKTDWGVDTTADRFGRTTYYANVIELRSRTIQSFKLAASGSDIAYICPSAQNEQNFEAFSVVLPKLNKQRQLVVLEKYAYAKNVSNSVAMESDIHISAKGDVLQYQRDRDDYVKAPVDFRLIRLRCADIYYHNLSEYSFIRKINVCRPQYHTFMNAEGTYCIFLGYKRLHWKKYDFKNNKVENFRQARFFKDDPEITEEALMLAKYDPRKIKHEALLVKSLKSLVIDQDETSLIYEIKYTDGNYALYRELLQ